MAALVLGHLQLLTKILDLLFLGSLDVVKVLNEFLLGLVVDLEVSER